jgi:hypothetical protein
VIINPRVGDMKGVFKTENILTQLEPLFAANRSMRIGILLTSEQEIQELIAILGRSSRRYSADLIYGTAVISEESMQRLAELCDIDTHLAEDKNSVRRYRSIFSRPATAILRDSFAKQKQERNQDYYPLEESIFTEDNIFFAEDGYKGFGDYQTIGEAFKEGGTMPRVVAIHLTYQRPRQEAIFIRHFCSTPNGSSADTAGKYLEALSKLVAFANDSELANPALDIFRSHSAQAILPWTGCDQEALHPKSHPRSHRGRSRMPKFSTCASCFGDASPVDYQTEEPQVGVCTFCANGTDDVWPATAWADPFQQVTDLYRPADVTRDPRCM